MRLLANVFACIGGLMFLFFPLWTLLQNLLCKWCSTEQSFSDPPMMNANIAEKGRFFNTRLDVIIRFARCGCQNTPVESQWYCEKEAVHLCWGFCTTKCFRARARALSLSLSLARSRSLSRSLALFFLPLCFFPRQVTFFTSWMPRTMGRKEILHNHGIPVPFHYLSFLPTSSRLFPTSDLVPARLFFFCWFILFLIFFCSLNSW